MLTHLRSDLQALGIAVPAAFVSNDEVRSAIETTYPASTPRGANQITGDLERARLAIRSGAVSNAVAAISDAGIARAGRQASIEIARELARYLNEREDEAVRDAAPILLDQLCVVAAKVLGKMAKAVRIVGPDPQNRIDGPDSWKAAQSFSEADANLTQIRSVLAALHAVRWLPVGSLDVALWMSPADPDRLAEARLLADQIGYANRIPALIAEGFELHLNTLAETVDALAAESLIAA